MGPAVAELAASIGLSLLPWQRQVVDVALELDPVSRLPSYREVRLTVPRQSGKSTLLAAVLGQRSLGWGGPQRCSYTAQDRLAAREKWEEHVLLLERSPLRSLFTVRRSNGSESIRWRNGSRWVVTAAMETSGHGQVLDLAVVDEAWSQPDDHLVQSFRPAMMTRESAQLWIVSTAGTEQSTFLRDRVEDGRIRATDGQTSGCAYFEWSAPDDADADDPTTWWSCMPALGHTVTEETVRADRDSMDSAEFARGYLNRWAGAGSPVLDTTAWRACADVGSKFFSTPSFAVDVTPERSAASIAVAGWRSDGRIHVELVDHRPGVGWAADRIRELDRKWHGWPVVLDGPAVSLQTELDLLGVPVEVTSTAEYASACAQFFDSVVDRTVAHLDQPALGQAVAAARKRPLGDAWAWARKAGGDVSPLVAATLARWQLARNGHGNPQIL
jgi:phage terminase large subunit-like protein